MGLPKDKRAEAPQETGPVMMTEQDWWELAHTVPIEPEAADNTIGGAGLGRKRRRRAAGRGHLDRRPLAVLLALALLGRRRRPDDEVLKGAGMLAAFKDEGVVFDSYLEDGYPGVFHDYANYVGWAMVERYISEELIGAAYSPSWGGLTQNPVIKSAVTLALEAVNFDRVPFLYTQGDTIGNTPDFDANMAVLNTDLLFTKMVDRRYRLGSASIAVPVTETERIPTWQEVATVQTISRRLEDYVPIVEPVVDWAQIEALRDRLVRGGESLLRGGDRRPRRGRDRHPRSGAAAAGPQTPRLDPLRGAVRGRRGRPGVPRGRRPVLETDLVRKTMEERERLLVELQGRREEEAIRGMKVLVTSTDVHEFAEFLLSSTLTAVGTEVIDFGINRDPEDIVKAVIETDADAVVITTHNGVARAFGAAPDEGAPRRGASEVAVFMGGVLNEDVDGSEIPIDVSADLNANGIADAGDDRPPRRRAGRAPRRRRRRSEPRVSVVALADFGSTYTKVSLVDPAEGRLLARAEAPTSIGTDLMDGYAAALDAADGVARGPTTIDERAGGLQRRRRAAGRGGRARRRPDRGRGAAGGAERGGAGRGRPRRQPRRGAAGRAAGGAAGDRPLRRRHRRRPGRAGAGERPAPRRARARRRTSVVACNAEVAEEAAGLLRAAGTEAEVGGQRDAGAGKAGDRIRPRGDPRAPSSST